MTKTKIPSVFGGKMYLYVTAFFFLSVFFVRVDGATKIAKADPPQVDCNANYDSCIEDIDSEDPNATELENDCFDTMQTCSNTVSDTTTADTGSTTDTTSATTSGTSAVTTGAQTFNTPADCAADDAYGSGYVPSADQTYCVPPGSDQDTTGFTDAQCKAFNPKSYAAVAGSTTNCQVFDPATEKCSSDNMCVTAKGDGFVCDEEGDCVVGGAAGALGSECRTGHDEDCTDVYGPNETCDSSGAINKCVTGPATAAQKADLATKQSVANSAAAAQQNAVKNMNAANAAAASCGTDTVKCAQAAQAQKDAQTALDTANATLQQAIADANAAAALVNPTTASTTGAGFNMCANGMIALVCSAVGSTTSSPITIGLPGAGTGLPVLGGLPTTTTPGVTGAQGGCDTGFAKLGGVCFPTQTGLSAAPISQILGNLFAWLMGLFTTLAVMAFVISGLQYLTAAGNEKQMETGKNNATYAVLGIIIGLSGFVIIKAIAAALVGSGYLF